MTPRKLAPEADLAYVIHAAKAALQAGAMLDPEELLCEIYGVDEADLQRVLEDDEVQGPPPLASHYNPQAAIGVPDQSGPAPRARGEWPGGEYRVAEAGTLAHLVALGSPLCGAVEAGPWRTVAGATRCAECEDLAEVLVRHG